MYNSEKIVWIKNVLRNNGEELAYDNVSFDKPFYLNWPTSKKGSALTPKIGDIIVLFQKPKIINGIKNYKVLLTHLVSPISDILHEDEKSPTHKWCREVQLIALAHPISAIPNPGYYNFKKPQWGLTNPIKNLDNNIGLTIEETKNDIWRLFFNFLNPILDRNKLGLSNLDVNIEEIEGDKTINKHIRNELTSRNSKIVRLAKSQAFSNNGGRLICECCSFDFLSFYGQLGSGFIECHHKFHISMGQRKTKLVDLALVCSNCHSMLHRKLENGSYHTIETLKEIIIKQNEGKKPTP